MLRLRSIFVGRLGHFCSVGQRTCRRTTLTAGDKWARLSGISCTVGHAPAARIFTGPRGGRITTAVLRDATHWDEVVTQLGYEHLRRHDLRHTGLTWMADAGVPVHVLRKIAGHGSLVTTQRYLHPDAQSIADAGTALSAHLTANWSPNGPQLRLVKDS